MAMAALLGRNASRIRGASRSTSHLISSIYLGVVHHSSSAPCTSLLVNPFITSRAMVFEPERYKLASLREIFFSTCAASDTAATANSKTTSLTTPSEKTGSGDNQSSGSEEGKGSGKSSRGPVSWLSFFLLLATGIAIVLYYDTEKKRHIEDINKQSLAVKEGPSAGKAAIGGPFNLINHEGKPVTEKDFTGKWTLIYFGFTFCPDICPAELEKLAAAVDKIKNDSGIEILPVFISVDPERDTVGQVREYVKGFHPELVGLTGSPEEIKKTARAYRVYYMKTEEEDADYLVDHSIVMYLMSPTMEFVKFFGKNNDINSLADGVIKEVKQYTSKIVS